MSGRTEDGQIERERGRGRGTMKERPPEQEREGASAGLFKRKTACFPIRLFSSSAFSISSISEELQLPFKSIYEKLDATIRNHKPTSK